MLTKKIRPQHEIRLRQKLAEKIPLHAEDKTKQYNEFSGLWLLTVAQYQRLLRHWVQRVVFFGIDMGTILDETVDMIVEAGTDEVLKQVVGEPQHPETKLGEESILEFLVRIARRSNIPRDQRAKYAIGTFDRHGMNDLKTIFSRSATWDQFATQFVALTLSMLLEHPRLKQRLPDGLLRQRLVDGGLMGTVVEDLWRVLQDRDKSSDARLQLKIVKQMRNLHLTVDMLMAPLSEAIGASSACDAVASRRLAADALRAAGNLQFGVVVTPDDQEQESDEDGPSMQHHFGVEPFGLTELCEREVFWQLKPRDRLMLLLYLHPFKSVAEFKRMALGVLGADGYSAMRVQEMTERIAVYLEGDRKGAMDAGDISKFLCLFESTVRKELSLLKKKFGDDDQPLEKEAA